MPLTNSLVAMKLILLAGLFCLAFLPACNQNELVAPHQDINALYERFHGKYKIISSLANIAIDANLDGKASTDMLAEIGELPKALIEIRIYKQSKNIPKSSLYFVHHWPKQQLLLTWEQEEPVAYDPGVSIQFVTKVVSWNFAFDPAVSHLIPEPNTGPSMDPSVFTPPHTLRIQASDRIEAIVSKRLYTTQGWKTVEITTIYERFTMAT